MLGRAGPAGLGPLALALVLLAGVAAVAPGTSTAAAGQSAPTSLAHWGSFFGSGSVGDTADLPETVSLPGPVVQVATSNSTIYALLSSGQVYAWGLGGDGQLGDGRTANALASPVRVRFPAGVAIADLPTDDMPYNTGLAVDTTGHAWGWGLNGNGELCLNDKTRYLTPVELPVTDVVAVAGAGDHALYDEDGTLFACGKNTDGDLGTGSTEPSLVPAPVDGLPAGEVKAVVAAFNSSGALLDNGTYLDWGYDNEGQLGDGTVGVDSSVPVAVSLPAGVVQVAQGGSYFDNGQTLVLLSDGTVMGWGDNELHQLDPGGPSVEPSPVLVTPPAGVTYEQVAAGADTSYAVSTTGSVYAWGGGAAGEIGNGRRHNASAPTAVESGVTCISSTALDVATC